MRDWSHGWCRMTGWLGEEWVGDGRTSQRKKNRRLIVVEDFFVDSRNVQCLLKEDETLIYSVGVVEGTDMENNLRNDKAHNTPNEMEQS